MIEVVAHFVMVAGASSVVYSVAGRRATFWAALFAGSMLVFARILDFTEEIVAWDTVAILGQHGWGHDSFLQISEGLGYTGMLFSYMAALGYANRAVQFANAEKGRAQALSNEVLLLARAADYAPEGLLGVDPEGKIRVWNRQSSEWFCTLDGELAGVDVRSLFQESDIVDEGVHSICSAAKSQTWGPILVEHRSENGGSLLVELTMGRVSDETGRVVGASLVARDADKLRAAQRALVKTSMLLSVALQRADVGFFIFDTDGDLIEYNPSMKALFGYERDEILGLEDFAKKVAAPDSDLVEVLTLDVLQGQGSVLLRDLEIVSQSGEKRICQLSVSPILDDQKNVIGTAGLAVDLTEQHRMAARLNQSQKMESVGRLAGGIAHDFNNILTSILGYASLIASREDIDAEVVKAAEVIQRSAGAAADLTRQLLMFSRGHQSDSRAIPLNDIAQATLGLVSGGLQRNTQFEMDIADDLLVAQGDPSQFQQVAMNLVVNAQDAVGDGGSVFVRTYNADRGGAKGVVLEVEDDGCGMPPDVVERMFEPFYSTKEQGDGYGLGMAVVYGIVESHGGLVEVESEVSKGTVIRVWLPAVEGENDSTGEDEVVEVVSRDHSGVVLVCDDEVLIRGLVRDSLRRKDFVVLEADCGEAALEILESEGARVEVVILDLVMPGIGGGETLRRLRSEYPHIRVLVSSGYGVDSLESGSVDGVYVRFIQKPFFPSDLLRELGELLGA